MSRQQDLEDALKSMTDLTVSPGIDITTSNINESNVKGYYHVLKAMGLATGLDSSSSIENVLKVWVDNKPIIQERESISFAGKFITELPYDALNEMRSLVGLNILSNYKLGINPEKFKTFQKRLMSISFSSCRMSPATFDAISNCECLEKLDLSNTPFKKIFSTDNYSWGNLKDTLIELNISRINMTIRTFNIIAELKSLRILHASSSNFGDISNWLDFKDLSNLTELDLSSNQLTLIPDGIDNLLNLTILDLRSNQLTTIPKSIGNLSKLIELDLSSNQLTLIPDGIDNLLNLTILDLRSNQLTTIPKSIGNLSKLTELDIANNQLSAIPESIGSLSNLKRLDLRSNQLSAIPESIGSLSNLTELYLSSNPLTAIPKSIGNLSNLKRLDLRSNQLTTIPESIGSLSNLKRLDLRSNRLTTIPESIGNLSNLKRLDLAKNQLTTIPESIGSLSNLKRLDLRSNQLSAIPESIGSLSNLTGLDIANNQLTTIPESIGNLSNLTGLWLSSNRLTTIPKSIGNLSNLTELYLYSNRLTTIPENIGNLSNLTGLNLYNNRLTSVPSTIRNLRNTLYYVNIRNNNDIVLYSNSEASFGLEQLIEVFGRRLRYTKPKVIPITIEEAYKKLMRMPIHWNFDRLKQVRATPIPHIDMTMDEMMAIWKRLPKEGIDERKISDMTTFIHHIYKPDESYSGEWKMAREYLQLSKNLLGSVLNIISTKSETDSELVKSNINSICEGLKHCNDRKLSELRLVYSILIDKLDNQDETLDGLINNIISNEKETMFDFTFIRNTNQSVHLLNYWKYRLRDEVGFDFDINTKFGTQGLDPFDGHSGNALTAFYSNFTPEHAIEVLTIRINQKENHTHMSELMKAIFNNNELTCEEKKSMLVGDIESSMFTGITRKGAKYYLLKQGLIIQNQE